MSIELFVSFEEGVHLKRSAPPTTLGAKSRGSHFFSFSFRLSPAPSPCQSFLLLVAVSCAYLAFLRKSIAGRRDSFLFGERRLLLASDACQTKCKCVAEVQTRRISIFSARSVQSSLEVLERRTPRGSRGSQGLAVNGMPARNRRNCFALSRLARPCNVARRNTPNVCLAHTWRMMRNIKNGSRGDDGF